MTSLLREETPLPMPPVASATITSWPRQAAARATASPTTPAPTTSTCMLQALLTLFSSRMVMEEFPMADNGQNVVRICSKSEVPPGSVKAFAVGANMLAVYNIDGAFYVTADECTHAAASLADGMFEGDVIECCMHMGSFHVPTGNVVAPPCEVPLRTYRVVLEGDDVFADLSRNAA